jgi:hypothetical protein
VETGECPAVAPLRGGTAHFVRSCTFSTNSAGQGGAIWHIGGVLNVTNCIFRGPSKRCVFSEGQGFLSLDNCYFSGETQDVTTNAQVEINGGKAQVRGCTFATNRRSVHLMPSTTHAILSDNNGTKGFTVTNDIGDKAILRDNEPFQPEQPATKRP